MSKKVPTEFVFRISLVLDEKSKKSRKKQGKKKRGILVNVSFKPKRGQKIDEERMVVALVQYAHQLVEDHVKVEYKVEGEHRFRHWSGPKA
jgi:hypothetical protein